MVEINNKRILILIWVLIAVLLLVNVAVKWRIDSFTVDCAGEYDPDGLCPCSSGKTNTKAPNFDTLNFTIAEEYIVKNSS